MDQENRIILFGHRHLPIEWQLLSNMVHITITPGDLAGPAHFLHAADSRKGRLEPMV